MEEKCGGGVCMLGGGFRGHSAVTHLGFSVKGSPLLTEGERAFTHTVRPPARPPDQSGLSRSSLTPLTGAIATGIGVY